MDSAEPRRNIFEIAVYRTTRDDWEERRSIQQDVASKVSWEYNQIIGWIRLLHESPDPIVKGYLWRVATIRRNGLILRRRKYQRGSIPYPFVDGYPTGKVLERLFHDETDAEIYNTLRSALLEVNRQQDELPGGHLDLRTFDTVGAYVRWRSLLRLGPSVELTCTTSLD